MKQLSETYNAVVCGFCLPYLSKPESLQLIADVAQRLSSNGIFYLSMMEGVYAESGFVKPSSGAKHQIVTYYHEANYLMETLEKHTFRVLRTYRQANGDMTDLTILAQKQ